MTGRIAIPMDSVGKWAARSGDRGSWKAADDVFTTVGDYATF
jgi:hypothetical protein